MRCAQVRVESFSLVVGFQPLREHAAQMGRGLAQLIGLLGTVTPFRISFLVWQILRLEEVF